MVVLLSDFVIENVPGDGSCFYHALSALLLKAGCASVDSDGLRDLAVADLRERCLHDTDAMIAIGAAAHREGVELLGQGFVRPRRIRISDRRFHEKNFDWYLEQQLNPRVYVEDALILELSVVLNVRIHVFRQN